MRSKLPKVLQPLAGQPILSRIINAAKGAGAEEIITVVGHQSELVQSTINDASINWIYQSEQNGTGHAVATAMPAVTGDKVLVLVGDALLIQPQSLLALAEQCPDNGLSLLTAIAPDATGLGRIIRADNGNVEAIIEHKDATESERQISEINTGIMCLSKSVLDKYLPLLSSNNAQGELYLTDVIGMVAKDGLPIKAVIADFDETMGVNDKLQLAKAERIYQRKQVDELMRAGCTLIDPERVDIRGNVSVGMDVIIDANVIFEGNVQLGDNVHIEANCIIKETIIGNDVHIKAYSHLEEAQVANDCVIGPYARLRPNANLAQGVKIGNFVEVKKSNIGIGSKVNHLSYIGDAEVGKDVNIGAGTITCNYDGKNKFKTEIDDGAFIGSNSALVAPVRIGKQSITGAGSAIVKEVPDDSLGVARGKQRNIQDWSKRK